jgi:multidrug efflux pump subunit AcrA (membrane-fusion protein)
MFPLFGSEIAVSTSADDFFFKMSLTLARFKDFKVQRTIAVMKGLSGFGWSQLVQHAGYALILAVLSGIGFLGHSLHWSFADIGHNAAFANAMTRLPGSEKDTSETSGLTVPQTSISEPASSASGKTLAPLVLPSANSLQLSGIEVEVADMHVLTQEIVASAEVQYDHRHTVELSSRVPGVIHKVLCQWGQQVNVGDILAIVEAGEVGRLKSEFAKALSERNLKRRTLDRLRSASHAIPEGQLLEAEGALQVATVNLLSEEQALVNLGFELTLDEFTGLSEDTVNKRLRTLGFDGELLTSIERSTLSSNLLPVRSPISGVIIGNDAAIGESVSSEKSFMQVSDVSRVWVTIHVRKEDATLIRIGQKVSFLPDGFDAPVEGKLNWISTEVDEKTRTLNVRAELTNPHVSGSDVPTIDGYALRANMFGVANVEIRSETCVAVTRDCLHMVNGQTLIFVQTAPDTFEPRIVKCEISQDEMAGVTGPVVAGDKVASRGSQLLKSELLLSRNPGRE